MRQVEWKARMKSPRLSQIHDRDEIQDVSINPNFSPLFMEFYGYPESVQSDGTISYIPLTFSRDSCFPAIIHGNVRTTDFARQTLRKIFPSI